MDVHYIRLNDGDIEINSVFTDFLPAYLSISDRAVLQYPNIIEDLSISSCNSISFCVIYFGPLLLGTYTLRIVSSRCIDPFFIHYVMPLIFLITFPS